jgi:hypothetical protein
MPQWPARHVVRGSDLYDKWCSWLVTVVTNLHGLHATPTRAAPCRSNHVPGVATLVGGSKE